MVLFGSEKFDFIYNRIRFLIEVINGITCVISHTYAKIKVDSFEVLPLKTKMTFHNVIMLINLEFDQDKKNYYYNIFLEKASYE